MKTYLTLIISAVMACACCQSNQNTDKTGKMLRGEASEGITAAFENYLDSIASRKQNVQSMMVVQHGKVVAEKWIS